MSNDLFNFVTTTDTWRNWYSHLSIHNGTDDWDAGGYEGGWYRVLITTAINSNNGRRMLFDIHDGDTGNTSTRVSPSAGAPYFTPEEWHMMALEIDDDSNVYHYQDNELIGRSTIPSAGYRRESSGRLLIEFEHSGPIYVGQADENVYPEGATVLVANHKVISWA